MNKALATVPEPDEGEDVEGQVLEAKPLHVLTLGDREFQCKDDAKIRSLFFRFADDPVRLYHEILVRTIDPGELNEAWDAFEAVSLDEGTDALIALAGTYTEVDRPSQRPSRSAGGSRSTKRR